MNKAGSITKKLKRQSGLESGLTTMEIMIAMFIFVLTISAVIMVLFGGQSTEIDTETNQEALYFAQATLEETRAKSRGTVSEFNSINSTPATGSGDIYTQQLNVNDISPCVKRVTSEIDWDVEGRDQLIDLTTIIGNIEAFIESGSDCSISEPSDEWKNPDSLASVDLQPSGVEATGIDVIDKIVYLSADPSSDPQSDLFIIDATGACYGCSDPPIIGELNIGPGLNDIDVVKNFDDSGKNYAFAANASKSQQFVVIDVSDPTNPSLVALRSLPGVNPSGSYPQGRSVFFHNSLVYVGTGETAGPEFHIFDVSDPTNPQWLDSIYVNRNINEIVVRDGLAYLATGPGASFNNPFKIFDVNPSSPTYLKGVGSFTAGSTTGNGRGLYVLGNKAYLGLERNSGDDFYILDISDPSNIVELGSKDFDDGICNEYNPTNGNTTPGQKCLGPNTEITGIKVVGKFAFLSTSYQTGGFQVWNIQDPANIQNCSMLNYSEKVADMDYEDNLVYLANQSQNALRIIFDNP